MGLKTRKNLHTQLRLSRVRRHSPAFEVPVQFIEAALTHTDILKQLFLGNRAIVVSTCAAKYTTTTPGTREKQRSNGGEENGLPVSLHNRPAVVLSRHHGERLPTLVTVLGCVVGHPHHTLTVVGVHTHPAVLA